MTQQNSEQKIAVIGIGLMGSRMATRLLKAGFPVTVRNRSPDKCRPLVELGAREASSAADAVADADTVITSLGTADIIEQVYFGADGVIPAAPKDCLIIDMSSLTPSIAQKNHHRLSEAGYAHHLDAPVSGGVSGAQSGTLSIMVGGSKADVDRAKPVLDILGKTFHLGDEGAGQICKLVNQTIVHVTIGAVTEGLLLASSLGIDAGKVREAISGGYCQSRILEVHGAKMVERDFVPGTPLDYSVKDLGAVVEVAEKAALNLPLSNSILAQYRKLQTNSRGRLDHSALLLAYEEANKPHRVSPEKDNRLP